MSNQNHDVNLNLNVKNRSLLDALNELQGDVAGLVPIAAKAASEVTEFQSALSRLDSVLQKVDDDELVFARSTEALTRPLKAAAAAVEDLGRKQADAARRTADMGRAAMNAGQSLQDLAQGGFGGMLNNIPRLTEDAATYVPWLNRMAGALGGPAGLAAAATITGVALYTLGPIAKGAFDALTQGSEKIPEAAEVLDRLDGALKRVGKELEEMRENWRGTSAEVRAYTKALDEQERMEDAADKRRKARKQVDAMRSKEAAPTGEQERAGGLAGDAIARAGGVDKVREALIREAAAFDEARVKAAEEARDRDVRANRADPYEMEQARRRGARAVSEARRSAAESRAQAGDRADQDIAAAGSGDQAAIERLRGSFPAAGFEAATKQGMAARDAADRSIKDALEGVADWARGVRSDADRRRKAEKDHAAQLDAEADAGNATWQASRKKNAEVEDLERQNSDFWDGQRQADEREAGRDAARASRESTPAARLRARREDAYDQAADVAMRDFGGDFSPAQLDRIAQDAANQAGGLDFSSIRQAVNGAAQRMQIRNQRELERAMGAMHQGGDSYFD